MSINTFYSDVVSEKLHELLTKKYHLTKEELDVMDYETIPDLSQHMDLDFLKIPDPKGKDGKSISAYKEKNYMRSIIKKLHYAIWELTDGGVIVD